MLFIKKLLSYNINNISKLKEIKINNNNSDIISKINNNNFISNNMKLLLLNYITYCKKYIYNEN